MNIMNSLLAIQSAAPTPEKPVRKDNIGSLLLDAGKITPEDAERVLRLQKIEGLRFGDAAKKLGLVTDEDIRQVLSMQFDYPYLQPGQGNFSPELVAAYQPFSAQVEALRALRSQLLLRWFSEGSKTLALVGANAGEGCSHLAANLAVVFSQLGEHTLLVDANLRDPCQHKIFGLGETLGLSDILAGRADMDAITRVDSLVDLSVLGAGTPPPNPQELLGRSTFTDFMNLAMGRYDVIIVDTPPVSQNSDALSTAAKCHGALLVSRLNRTRIAELASVREQITLSGARIVGAVVNDF
ncbi:MAG TPA: chain length determinant protein tyrosine kinase EpsG [Gallionella sp.]|nr:chain length determinant protein tyrosine kinase EpsG [Gallionella sp.]